MLRIDLEAAGLPYRDAAGLVFDFHSLEVSVRHAGRSSRFARPGRSNTS